MNRRDEIDIELRQLRRLVSDMDDLPETRERLKGVIIKLESEQAALPPKEK